MKRFVLGVVLVLGCGKVKGDPPGPESITVEVAQASSFLREGESVDLDVTVTRTNIDSDVDITVAGLPTGVTADALQIAAAATTGTLHLSASPTATQGAVDPVITAVALDNADANANTMVRLLVGGAPGTPDTSFADDGTFTPTLGGLAMACRGLVTTDAGLIVTGFVVSNPPQAITARILDDGSLDPAFGSGGFVSTGAGGLAEGIAVTTASNGDILVAGIAGGTGAECDFGVFRYDGAGTLVSGFGASGVATFDPGTGCAEWHNIAVDHPAGAADDRILVGGALFGNNTSTRAALYNGAGVKNPGFNINEASVVVQGSVVQPDGKLVMVGNLNNSFWIGRFNTDGSHDAGFGTNGIVTTTPVASAVNGAFGVVALPGNKLLVVGTSGPNVAAARYNANGSPDVTFGNSGVVVTTTTFETRSPTALAVDGNRIYFVGRRVSDKAPAVVRLLDDGTVDTTFGDNGLAVVDFGVTGTTANTGGFGVAVDPDGRVLLSGDVGASGAQQMAIARLWF